MCTYTIYVYTLQNTPNATVQPKHPRDSNKLHGQEGHECSSGQAPGFTTEASKSLLAICRWEIKHYYYAPGLLFPAHHERMKRKPAEASYSIIASLFRTVFIYPKHSRSAEYLSEREKETFTTKDRETQKECLLPPQMKWPCGWMYMWVQAARSCEWEVGTEWEEKSCFSETIGTKARWKAVTLSWLVFVFCTCTKTEFQVVRLVMDGG